MEINRFEVTWVSLALSALSAMWEKQLNTWSFSLSTLNLGFVQKTDTQRNVFAGTDPYTCVN